MLSLLTKIGLFVNKSDVRLRESHSTPHSLRLVECPPLPNEGYSAPPPIKKKNGHSLLLYPTCQYVDFGKNIVKNVTNSTQDSEGHFFIQTS